MSPDGRRLASFGTPWLRRAAPAGPASGEVRMWDLTTYQELRRLTPRPPGGPGAILAQAALAAFAPDGRTLASAGGERTGFGEGIQLWDVETGRELRAWAAGPIGCIAFSPDG